jgi:hypothetical protein
VNLQDTVIITLCSLLSTSNQQHCTADTDILICLPRNLTVRTVEPKSIVMDGDGRGLVSDTESGLYGKVLPVTDFGKVLHCAVLHCTVLYWLALYRAASYCNCYCVELHYSVLHIQSHTALLTPSINPLRSMKMTP